jgi:RHS repeat-associated protein
MSQSKPDDPVNSSAPRVVLLATDRSQSIIGEIVDGQTHTIAYSAYGEQSAQQKVETRLGFNGQLREAYIGWYLLGNGYRAYNPRLMRFHSPDTWSPFGGGGLNAYMYCVGDPVNRVDPTGHVPWTVLRINRDLKRVMGQVFDFFFGGSNAGSHGVLGSNDLDFFMMVDRRGSQVNVHITQFQMRPEKEKIGQAFANTGGHIAKHHGTFNTKGSSPPLGEGGTTTPFVPPKPTGGNGPSTSKPPPPGSENSGSNPVVAGGGATTSVVAEKSRTLQIETLAVKLGVHHQLPSYTEATQSAALYKIRR